MNPARISTGVLPPNWAYQLSSSLVQLIRHHLEYDSFSGSRARAKRWSGLDRITCG